MRQAIRQRLLEQGFERIYEPTVPNVKTKKPYLVIQKGVQSAEDPYAGYSTIVEVWPFLERLSFEDVDAMTKQIKNVLNHHIFQANNEPHYIEYDGTTGQDTYVEEWDAYTRGLRFHVFPLGWLSNETTAPDPVQALNAWTAEHFPSVQTNPAGWLPTEEAPALYWRFDQITETEPEPWGAWIRGTVRGHLIVPDVKERLRVVKDITQTLATKKRTRLSDGSPLEFAAVSANSAADMLRDGQITLSVRYGVLDVEDAPELLNIYIGGGTNE